MKKRILVVTLLCMAMTVAYAQTYDMPSPNSNGGAIQSQQIMPTRNYNGTVYEPFSTSTPSEQSAVGAAYSPAQAPGGPRRDKIGGPDTPPANESPIGEPWIMAAFALLLAGAVALRRRKAQAKSALSVPCKKNSIMKQEVEKNNIKIIILL